MGLTPPVSIPRSGFCVFGPFQARLQPPVGERFNPSVGILCFRTTTRACTTSRTRWFQSLGRDSVFSDDSVIIDWGQNGMVSIPRSGFCVFGRLLPLPRHYPITSFNPSVGILCFRTINVDARRACPSPVSIPRSGFCVFGLWSTGISTIILGSFQSLGRDSVFSDGEQHRSIAVGITVSIPRSGFCVFGPEDCKWAIGATVEFQSLGRDSVFSDFLT